LQTQTALSQIESQLDEIEKVLARRKRAREDPCVYIEDTLASPLWSKQREIVESVKDNPATSVRSCHGPGKTYVAARIALEYLEAYAPSCKVVTTAPTGRQVVELLWREIRAGRRKHPNPPGRILPVEAKIEVADEWFAIGFASKDTDSDSFQGWHSPHLLVIADEAAGISETIKEGIDGILTSEHARLLAIGNPTSSAGWFYESHNSRRDLYNCISISAFETPNFTAFGITEADIINDTWQAKITGELPVPALVTPAWVAKMWAEWGRDASSPLWQAKVLGQFPDIGEDSIIPLPWIEAAQGRTVAKGEPVELAADIARFGSDQTVIGKRWGNHCEISRVTAKRDTMQTTGDVIDVGRDDNPGAYKIDVVGLGAGVVDRLKEQQYPVVEMSAGEKAIDEKRFANRATEWHWHLRELLDPTNADPIDLPPSQKLAADLAGRKYKVNSRGQIVLEPKEDFKKRLGRSPDEGDMVAMLFAKSKGAPVFL
jgi:hypothetical protein